ncbi:efflux RND transporter permease subunit, partial [Thermodesulfobacteriota bacterium]
MKRILTAFAGNTVFANILFCLILLAGWIASNSMIRESMPEMALDMIRISVSYPGADPEEVEEGISRKIEEALKGMEGIKRFTTYSSENRGTSIIEVKQAYDKDEIMERIKTKVEAIPTFPVDSENPIIEEMTVSHRVMSLYLTGDMSERQLKVWAEKTKDEIQEIPDITQVSLFGTRDYEINIEVSEERLREYGLTISQVTNAVRKSNMNLAGGTIRTQGEEIRIRTLGRKYTGEELSSIVVVARPEGEIITLDRLAVIDDGFNEDPVINKVDGEPAVIVSVYNSSEEDALTISKAVRDYLKKKERQLPEGAVIKILYDETDMLQARIDLLVRNGLIGLFIVFLFLWAFMDMRVSFWSGMGIPVSIAGGMVVLWIVGGTINMMSLFAFILILGIVVDDAIVVGESIYVHRKNGASPIKAAVEGVWEVGLPVIAAVLTTIVAFLPLAKVGGIMGKFIFILPIIVIACLGTSLLECLALLPAHLNHLPDPNGRQSDRIKGGDNNSFIRGLGTLQRFTSLGMEKFVERIYTPFLKKALRWRYISFCVAVSILLLTIGLVRGGIVKYEMFPDIDGFIITSTLKFPDGTTQEITRNAVEQVEAALMRINERTETVSGEPLLAHSVGIVGQTFEIGSGRGPNLGAIEAILLPSEKRGIHTKDLSIMWEKEVGGIPGIESITFEVGGAHGP